MFSTEQSNFGLEQYSPDEAIPDTSIVTITGSPSAGKGVLGKALEAASQEDGRTLLMIVQGYKFRVITKRGLEEGVNFCDKDSVDSFLIDPSTRPMMLESLQEIADMPSEQVNQLLRTPEISHVVSKIGENPASQDLAINLMFDEVADASARKIDLVVVDGRAVEQHARRLSQDKVAIYAVGVCLECDPVTAARRDKQDFRPIEEIAEPDMAELFRLAESSRLRHHDDYMRDVEPYTYPDGAYSLDLRRGLPTEKADLDAAMARILQTKLVSVVTSHTADKKEMTDPTVQIICNVLDAVDTERALCRFVPSYFEQDSNEFRVD